MINNLDVYLWNNKVGTLVSAKNGYREKICFYFDPEFIKKGLDIAPLQASIKSGSVVNGFPVYGESDKMFAGLPSFLADSLPDNWGATVFREWAMQKGIKMRKLSSLDRLAYLGRRGMGALEFVPPIESDLEKPFAAEIKSLYEMASSIVDNARSLKFKLSPDLKLENLLKVGTSAGGKRPKAVLNIDYETGDILSGQVLPPSNRYRPVILKFEENIGIPTTKIEYSFYLMAKEAGLRMMPSRLIEVDGKTHFITERFDRQNLEKLHVQTLAAMNPLAEEYEDLFDVGIKLKLQNDELEQMFLAMTLNVICGNVDDHNKNFSFIMDRAGNWGFAPVYDFTFTIDPSAPEYVNVHSLTVDGKKDNIKKENLLNVAKRFNIKDPESLIKRVINATENYPAFACAAGVDELWTQIILKTISSNLEDLSEP